MTGGAEATREAPASARSPAEAARQEGRAVVLERVPRPAPESAVVMLGGLTAGGLEAVMAEWGPEGGVVTLSGRRPFVDITGRATFRPDGSLDGRVELAADVALLGLGLGRASWSVDGWDPGTPLAAPVAELRGTDLRVDLTPLPAGATLAPAEGFDATVDGTVATVALPADAAPAGEPLSPRLAEAFRGLLGVDIGDLTVHRDAPVDDAPAFVADRDLFFAPGVYGAEGPETLRILDAAIRSALAGILGPVGDAPPVDDAMDLVPAGTGPPPTAGATPSPPGGPTATGPGAETAREGPAEEQATADGAEGRAATESSAEGPAPAQEEPGPAGAAEPPAETAPPVELIMAPAPAEPTPATRARGGAVAGGARASGGAARAMPAAAATADAARGAVEEPAAETMARAQEAVAAELGERPPPSPEIVELAQRIRTAIRENRPEDEDELLRTDPTAQARDAGATVTGAVEGQTQEVGGAYDQMGEPATGDPALNPRPAPTQDPAVPGMGVDATTAAPDPLPEQSRSLDADVSATDTRIEESGIDTRVTREIPDGPFAQARTARGELGELAQRTPAEIAAEEQAAIDGAQADMARLQLEALASMRAAREGTVGDVGEGVTGMTGQEELTRDAVAQRAQAIFDSAERRVSTMLEPLSRTALQRWDTGLARLSREFNDALDRVQRWIDDRHSGVVGTLVAIGDAIVGLPRWVTDEYNRAEREFGDGVADLLIDISRDVNTVVVAAQAVIQTARTDIDALFDQMEAEFPEWAAQERARFAGMLDGLDSRVTEAQTGFVRDVRERAITAVNEAHATVEAKREEAGGLIGKVISAIEEFVDDPARAIINGLLRLVGIAPGEFWALIAQIEQVIDQIAADPENFINNLVAGVKLGFQQFFDHFGTHLLTAFWNWLFSGLETPIAMPTTFDALSLMKFALELMGITWPNIREILVRHVGPTAVEVAEAAWELLSVLIDRGPEGVVEMVKEQLSPDNIVGMILDAAIEYLVETLVVQVAQYLFSLLNPVGAIAQAVRLIYQVCAWIFRNAARIFSFVQAVVGGIANVIAGNISGMATTVERALVVMIVVAIDFLAGLLGLGGLPDEVAAVIVRMQTYVLSIVERIVVFFVERARALLARMGIGGEPEEGDGNEDDELGTTVRFSGGGESHRLYFQVAGEDATLMVASVPESVASKIADWRGRASGLPEGNERGQRDDASRRLDALESVADAADTEGDQLARQFLAASADANDEVEPPSDDALENRQRAMSGMLAELFEIMEGRNPDAFLAGIRENLPRFGQAYARTVHEQWLPEIRKARRAPAGGAAGERLWGDTVLGGTTTNGLTYLELDTTHRSLLPYFLVGSTSNPRSAATGAFDNHALRTDSPDPPHGVRQAFIERLGSAAAEKMKRVALQDIAPEDNDAVRQLVQQLSFSSSNGRWGAFTGMPVDAVSGMVKDAVDAAGGILEFMRAMATSQAAGGLAWAEFTAVWNSSPRTKEWVKAQFRGVRPRAHEWIPTSELTDVVQHAINQAALNPGDVRYSVGWIDFFSALRSDTHLVRYWIQAPPADPGVASTAATDVGFGSHSGAEYAEATGNRARGIIGQGDFHDLLRDHFRGNRDNGPIAYGQSLVSYLPSVVWTGTLNETMAPRTTWFTPIEVFFVVEIHAGGAVRVYGLTLAQLAIRQQQAWQTIQSDFTRALYAVG